MPILSWIVSALLALAAIIAGWFVTKDAPNFSIAQMIVALLLLAGAVALAAGLEKLGEWLRARRPGR